VIGWLIRWCSRTCPDAQWQPTGYSLTTEATYDQDKAVSGRRKALARAKAARKVADAGNRRAVKRQAPVVQIETRRRG
jgi:hypothetical protein